MSHHVEHTGEDEIKKRILYWKVIAIQKKCFTFLGLRQHGMHALTASMDKMPAEQCISVPSPAVSLITVFYFQTAYKNVVGDKVILYHNVMIS